MILGALAAFSLTNLMRNDIHPMLVMSSVYPGFLLGKCGDWLITWVYECNVMGGVQAGHAILHSCLLIGFRDTKYSGEKGAGQSVPDVMGRAALLVIPKLPHTRHLDSIVGTSLHSTYGAQYSVP